MFDRLMICESETRGRVSTLSKQANRTTLIT